MVASKEFVDLAKATNVDTILYPLVSDRTLPNASQGAYTPGEYGGSKKLLVLSKDSSPPNRKKVRNLDGFKAISHISNLHCISASGLSKSILNFFELLVVSKISVF